MYSLERYTLDITVDDFKKKHIDVEKFLGFCKACPNYSKIWSCPSYDFDPMDVWNKYSYLTLLSYKITFENENSEEREEAMLKVKMMLLKELLQVESYNPDSLALGAGACNLCGKENCARRYNEPCRNPQYMRYSIESLGGDVVGALKEYFNLEISWGENGDMPPYIILLGGLLSK